MLIRALRSAVVAAGLAVALAACAPTPEPSEPAPLFSSDAEAFAAAEETYRAYVDAVNARRANPNSADDPLGYLVSQALEVEVDSKRQLEAAGLKVAGDTTVPFVNATRAADGFERLQMSICLDSSGSVVMDSSGVDVTPADRATQVLLSVEFVLLDGVYLVEASNTLDGRGC